VLAPSNDFVALVHEVMLFEGVFDEIEEFSARETQSFLLKKAQNRSSHAAPNSAWSNTDTILFDDLREIPQRYPEIALALFHLGGTKIMGKPLTLDGE
jgi:hypothetical protein